MHCYGWTVRGNWHVEQKSLQCGLPGVVLQSAPPLVYTISPALHFHPSTHTLLRYLSPDIEIIRIGLTENWRRGIRVVMRQ